MTRTLVRVEAPHYVAGLVLDAAGKCIEAAPILRWALGKRWSYLEGYFTRKGFGLDVRPHPEEAKQ